MLKLTAHQTTDNKASYMNKKSVVLFPLFLVCYEICIYLSMDAYVPALTRIATELHASANAVQLTVTFWMLGGFFSQLFIGPISDHIGRRPVLLWGGVCYILSTLACGLVHNITLLIMFRLIQGMCMPSMYIAGYAAINELFESQQAIKILARLNSITILAPAFGPMLGGLFLLYYDWQWIFYILTILSCLAVIALFYTMPETVVNDNRTLPSLSTTLHHYISLFKNKNFIVYSLMAFVPIIGLIAWIIASSIVLIAHFHFSTFEFGLVQSLIFIGFIIGTKITSKLTDTHTNKLLIHTGITLTVIGSLISLISNFLIPHTVWGVVMGMFILCLGSGMIMPILSRLSLESSQQPMGVSVTVFSIIRIGSGVLGSLAMVLLFADNFTSMTILIFICALVTAGLNYFIIEHKPSQ